MVHGYSVLLDPVLLQEARRSPASRIGPASVDDSPDRDNCRIEMLISESFWAPGRALGLCPGIPTESVRKMP